MRTPYGILVVAIVCFALSSVALMINAIKQYEPCPKAMPEKTHLPSLCKQYYYDEGDAWIECMGVGRK